MEFPRQDMLSDIYLEMRALWNFFLVRDMQVQTKTDGLGAMIQANLENPGKMGAQNECFQPCEVVCCMPSVSGAISALMCARFV